jgi:hypothetical protein
MTKTWLVTGSSRGFGRELSRAILDHGDNLVATARKPEQLDYLFPLYGDRVRSTLRTREPQTPRSPSPSTSSVRSMSSSTTPDSPTVRPSKRPPTPISARRSKRTCSAP